MKKLYLIFIIIFFLTSCQSFQDGLTGKKRSETNDEFFVIKKNPLTMPPDFEKLPKPIDEEIKNFEDEEDENEIIRLFTEENKGSNNISTKSSSLENSILEKINEQ